MLLVWLDLEFHRVLSEPPPFNPAFLCVCFSPISPPDGRGGHWKLQAYFALAHYLRRKSVSLLQQKSCG